MKIKKKHSVQQMLYKYYNNVIRKIFSDVEDEYNEEHELINKNSKLEAFFCTDKTHFVFVRARHSFELPGTPLDENSRWIVTPTEYRKVKKDDEFLIRIDDIHKTVDVQLLRFTEKDVTFRLTGPEFKNIINKVEQSTNK